MHCLFAECCLVTIKDIIDKYHHNPKKILGLNENYGQDSFIEINLDKEYTIRDEDLITKAGWSPFNNFNVKGCLERFIYKNECVYNNGLSNELRLGQNVNIYKNNSKYNLLKSESENNNNINNLENEELDVYKLDSIINVDQFNRDNLRVLFKNACIIKQNIKKNGSLDVLKGKVIGLYFDEPSTRTYGSFSVAVQKLGGSILSISKNNSSSKKGETLYDTLKCFETYCDLIVIRTSTKNTLRDIKDKIKIPIINAGDGDDEHPTQALLDVFTIREERGTVNNLVVSIVGDLKYGRTVHSLVKLLSIYDITFNFVSLDELEL